jgi:uncharacterized membrane protein YjjP (DUF1212 family)
MKRKLLIAFAASLLMFLVLYYLAKFGIYTALFVAIGASVLTYFIFPSKK